MEASNQMEPSTTPAETLTAAVLKAAATAVKSCADSILSSTHGGDCINDPRPATGGTADAVTGILPEHDPPGACATEKGGRVVVGGGGDVAVPGENGGGAADVVVVPGTKAAEKGGELPCVDALQGLDVVGVKGRNGGGGEVEVEEEGDEEEEEAVLVEGVV